MTSQKPPRVVFAESLPPRGSIWRFEDGRTGVVASSQQSGVSGGVVVYVGPQSFTVPPYDAELVFGRARPLGPGEPTTEPTPEPARAKCHRAASADPFRALCGDTSTGDTVTSNSAVDCAACLAVMTTPSPEPDASRLIVARRGAGEDASELVETVKVEETELSDADAVVAEVAEVNKTANVAATAAVVRAEELKTSDAGGAGGGRSSRRGKRERKA